MDEFKEHVRKMIDIPDDEKEPFCPFPEGGYCDVAYTDECYQCEFAQANYKRRYKENG